MIQKEADFIYFLLILLMLLTNNGYVMNIYQGH